MCLASSPVSRSFKEQKEGKKMKLLGKQAESVLTEFSKILLSMLTTREDNILLC